MKKLMILSGMILLSSSGTSLAMVVPRAAQDSALETAIREGNAGAVTAAINAGENPNVKTYSYGPLPLGGAAYGPALLMAWYKTPAQQKMAVMKALIAGGARRSVLDELLVGEANHHDAKVVNIQQLMELGARDPYGVALREAQAMARSARDEQERTNFNTIVNLLQSVQSID